MKALLINCTLKPSPEKSNTEALRKQEVEVASVRAVDHAISPGGRIGDGRGRRVARHPPPHILDSEILIFATPTWLGRPSRSPSECWSEWTR
jgi:multimeric flavodoxin WrbA